MSVEENMAHICRKVEEACALSARALEDVKLIAVTKYASTETAQSAVNAGIEHIGENRDNGFLNKYETLGDQAVWHFIGTLQSRKVKAIIDKVDYIHSLDRLSLAKEIEKRSMRKVNCFVQVNASGEDSKHGLATSEVVSFIRKLANFPKIQVVGLMTMAPHAEDPEETRPVFRSLKKLQQTVQSKNWRHASCTELSMGMSNDYPIAIEEGATFVRIGTALVGKEF